MTKRLSDITYVAALSMLLAFSVMAAGCPQPVCISCPDDAPAQQVTPVLVAAVSGLFGPVIVTGDELAPGRCHVVTSEAASDIPVLCSRLII